MIQDLRSSYDTWIRSDLATRNFGQYTYLSLGSGSPVRTAFIYFPRKFPIGASIASGILSLFPQVPWAGGTATITVRRISTPWKESGAGSVTPSNQPSVAGAVVTATANNGDTRIDIDVTALLAEAAAGNEFHGFRISSSISGVNNMNSGEAPDPNLWPELVQTWSTAPGAPTNLHPGGGRLCSIAQPTFTWQFNDADGDPQSAYYFQLSANADMSSPAVDTGWVTDSAQEKVLTEVSLADGNVRYWRVKAKDDSGVESPWSDIQQVTRDVKGTLAITDPTSFVEDASPPITHTFSGETQAVVQYLLSVEQADGSFVVVYDSGRRATTAMTFTLPDGYINDPAATYKITVRVWDNKPREQTPGDTAYVEASQTFAFHETGAATAVSSLVATTDDTPAVTLRWTRSSTPDYWSLKVDGKIVNARIDPASVLVGTLTWSMKVWELDPAVTHTLEIEPVVISGGLLKHTSGNPTVTANTSPADCWLILPDKNIYVRVATEQAVDAAIGQDIGVFFPEGRRDPVIIEDVLRGLEGTISGTVSTQAERAAFENVKSWAHAGARCVMILGDRQFQIAMGDISRDAPIPGSDNDWHQVSFRFWQIANFFVAER